MLNTLAFIHAQRFDAVLVGVGVDRLFEGLAQDVLAALGVGDQAVGGARGCRRLSVAGQVRFDVQVLVRRLDGLRHANDVGDGRGRRDGHDVGVADAFFTRSRIDAQSSDSVRSTSMYCWPRASMRICWESSGRMPLDHQRAVEAGVGAALVGQVTGGLDGVVADGFHGLVGEVDGGIGAVGDVLQVQGVLEDP
ncbi:hypothetical protein SSTU70S_02793 [Stutzerimonas stutzeri]